MSTQAQGSQLRALGSWRCASKWWQLGKHILKPIGFKLITEIPLSSISPYSGGDVDQAVNHQQ